MNERKKMSSLSDVELLRRSGADPEAFGELFRRHFDRVTLFLLRRTRSADSAADLAAETFAQAYLSRKSFRDTGRSALAWLLGIADHKFIDSVRHEQAGLRARKKLQMMEVPLDDESIARLEELLDFVDKRVKLDIAMSRVPPGIARAVYLRIGCDMPYESVAHELKCTSGAARVRVARGLASLADLMEEEHESRSTVPL
jgi:RNA polymerase sigma factor (sigma-70 family)